MNIPTFEYMNTFHMETKPVFIFGIIADIQYCDAEPAYGRYYRASVGKLTDALNTFQQLPLSFILDLGDLIDRNFTSFDTVLGLYRKSPVPVRFTLGNHDYSVAEDQKKEVTKAIGLPAEGYYDFVEKGWRFIILNGNELSLFATPEGTGKEREALAMLSNLRRINAENAMEWNGGISRTQRKWLAERLEDAEKQKQKVIVVGHYPLYPSGMHNLWNDEEIVALLTHSPHVVAYFNGHQHQGNYASQGPMHFMNFKGMVETETENAFALVSVYDDRLEVKGFGREESRILQFE